MKKIIDGIVNLLGNRYQVVNSWDNDNETNLNGCIAVGISGVEYLNHGGNTKDKKITIIVAGQILTQQDLNQSKIMMMFDYATEILEKTDLTVYLNDYIDGVYSSSSSSSSSSSIDYGVAGTLFQNSDITSNGEVNTFSISFDVFVCQD